MTLRFGPATVAGRIAAPGSKSHTHRALILAALSGNGSVKGALLSDDTRATLDCLQSLGMLATVLPHEIRVGGTWRKPHGALDAKSSGTTLRLMAAVAALRPDEIRLEASPQLQERPMEPLLRSLNDLGATVESANGRAPLRVRGPLRGGATRMPGGVSSQFVSALLMACPVAAGDASIDVEPPLRSRPYVDLTLAQLRHHGVLVHEDGTRFHVPGRQEVRQRPYTVPGDYSSAAFLLVGAAITGGSLTVENLAKDDPQGDRAIVDHLRAFGARVTQTEAAVSVERGELRAATIDVGPTPDLFPALCVLAARAKGTSVLHGAPHLRLKESDRVRAMATNLGRAGVAVEERPDGLRITGSIPKGIIIEAFDDHRIAMAMATLALVSAGSSVLPDGNVVAKSYPNFHSDLLSIAPEVARA